MSRQGQTGSHGAECSSREVTPADRFKSGALAEAGDRRDSAAVRFAEDLR